MKKILITGGAGFIGSHLVKNFSKIKNHKIFVIDNLNSYYDKNLKLERLKNIKKEKKIIFKNVDICNNQKLLNNFKKNKYDYVFHLAAQAGVRYSITKPKVYLDNNINGFFNILEACRDHKIKRLFFASSSSVYGDQKKYPVSENFDTNNPKSFYAATKKCNEIMAQSYCNIYNMNITGLRFFTVYGSYGRPDMTPFVFLENLKKNKKISIHNRGIHERDFTHINDIVNMIDLIYKAELKNKIKENFQIFNLCKGYPEKLKNYIKLLELKTKKKFKKNYKKRQAGDVIKTFGDNFKVKKLTKYNPRVSLSEGLDEFLNWYFKSKFKN